MNPGATMSPRASNFSSAPPRILLGREISTTCPSRNRMSISASTSASGSIRRPPRISSEPGLPSLDIDSACFPQRPRQHCHAQRHAILDFFDDHRLRTIRHFPVQLHPAHDGTRLHHHDLPLPHPPPPPPLLIPR